MKIAIDIDNVIAHTFRDLVRHFNEFMGKKHGVQEVVDIMRQDKIKMLGYWFQTWRKKLLTQVTPIEGAIETIREWHPLHEIRLITSRLPLFNRQTKEWLKFHGIPFQELHHAKEKTKFKKARGFDVFLEDNLAECEILADHCKKVFIFDQPWNQKADLKNNIIRVKNWQELRKHFKP
jgi:uncharacterized HAD superfamily protein